ncbi:MAG: hypothetical protein J7L63_00400 [Thermoplasmata archaeon]|nr:hypothetical protein [Thermoplasmata archaeon]
MATAKKENETMQNTTTSKTVTGNKLMEAIQRTYGPLAKATAINEAFFPGRGWVQLNVDARLSAGQAGRASRDWREVLAEHIQLTAELGATAWNLRVYTLPNWAGQPHDADFNLAELVG